MVEEPMNSTPPFGAVDLSYVRGLLKRRDVLFPFGEIMVCLRARCRSGENKTKMETVSDKKS